MKAFPVLRPRMRRSIWCEGCGLGNLQTIMNRALIKTVGNRLSVDVSTQYGLEKVQNNIALVSGIGCTSRLPGHFDFNTVHTTHGRSLAFATGLKMARPDLTVALAAGDGDIFAIGGNHFIHAARRNPDLTLIVYDNRSYGMTGAQHSPTSPMGEVGTSVPYGAFEPPFNLVKLALGAGASFVAQGAVTTLQEHEKQLEELISAAIAHRGFSFVNVIGTCHTGWGALNRRADAFRYRRFLESRVVLLAQWEKLPPSEQERCFPLGIIRQEEREDLQSSRSYQEAVAKAKAAAGASEELLEDIALEEMDPLTEYPRTGIRFAGSGGQGVITAGEITLSSALRAGLNGVFTKNYGPEARGGEAYSDVLISRGEIHFPQTESPDVLVALNAETYNKFRGVISPTGKIIVNSTAVAETYGDKRAIPSPLGELLAREVRPPRRELGINVLALAVTLGYLQLIPNAAVEAAVMKSVGKRNPELNRRALDVGFKEAERLRGLA
ncbi:MAG: 2-oxoacid:acceptor oxidoreductase family protein [Acidobacteria bacterium]|nr:2-oxoacid:acceptor oxidoreductase family protein [Acidobacteriota bacterium]MBI3656094.1 2-oxoacid:acceptor oxidoreductase family protein [Acidobacteriota bacterium]